MSTYDSEANVSRVTSRTFNLKKPMLLSLISISFIVAALTMLSSAVAKKPGFGPIVDEVMNLDDEPNLLPGLLPDYIDHKDDLRRDMKASEPTDVADILGDYNIYPDSETTHYLEFIRGFLGVSPDTGFIDERDFTTALPDTTIPFYKDGDDDDVDDGS